MRTEVSQRVRSAKQVSKLSLGLNKHGQNITTPSGLVFDVYGPLAVKLAVLGHTNVVGALNAKLAEITTLLVA